MKSFCTMTQAIIKQNPTEKKNICTWKSKDPIYMISKAFALHVD